jgi:hypothetical protein
MSEPYAPVEQELLPPEEDSEPQAPEQPCGDVPQQDAVAVAPAAPVEKPAPITFAGGLQIANLDELWRVCTAFAKSGMTPKGMTRPEQILVAVQTGAEAGLTPMQSLRSLVVINGYPSWRSDAALALVRSSGLCLEYDEGVIKDDEGGFVDGWAKAWRVGQPHPEVRRFTVEDAVRAGLWGKSGPWKEYPQRMLVHRARGFLLNDVFGDVLRGLKTEAEMRDYPRSAPERALNADPVPPRRGTPLLAKLRGEEGESGEAAESSEVEDTSPGSAPEGQ